jgi:hypothetical protein
MLFEDKDRKVPLSVCRGEIINRIFWRRRVESEFQGRGDALEGETRGWLLSGSGETSASSVARFAEPLSKWSLPKGHAEVLPKLHVPRRTVRLGTPRVWVSPRRERLLR